MPSLPHPITSRSNARVKALRAAFTGRAARPGELAGIEGWKTIAQAVQAGLSLETVAIAQGREHRMRGDLQIRELLVLSPAVMASVADTLSPPEIVASFAIPHAHPAGGRTGVYLVLEDIQDPGNLGTLIRSAEAFGVDQVYLSPGCANPWAPKVIRASAGSVLRQPVLKQSISSCLQTLRDQHVHLMAAVAESGEATTAYRASFHPPFAILIGNEGGGLSSETLSLVHERVYIPCHTESLNAAVAGSMLLYEAQRHLVSQTPFELATEHLA